MKPNQYLPDPNPPAVDVNQQGSVIALQDDIAAMRCRIARAEVDRDTWKMSGSSERYLEGFFLVDALELQLDAMLRKLRALR